VQLHYQALAPHRLTSADPPNSAEDLWQLRLERQSVCITGDQLGKSEGASGHIVLGSADPTPNGLCDKCEKRSTARSWDVFAWEARHSKRTWIDANPGLVCRAQAEVDMHDVKRSPSTSARSPKGSEFPSLRGICIILSYASTCL
jgi:hypothetical protein